MCITEIGSIALYRCDSLLKFDKLVHGFTTRKGGVSKGEYDSLSMSPWRGDDIACVKENEKILCKSLSLDLNKLTATKQEHTDNIKIIDSQKIGYGIQTQWEYGVDACITTEKNVTLLCYSADCVPVLLYACDIEAIAAIHAGWRGSRDCIVKKTTEKIKELGAKTENIYAAIGPCIHKCCYEVSDDVAQNFSEKFYDRKADGKFMLDLADVNRQWLLDCGVKSENISVCDLCTKCNNDLFFSHRAQNGKSGTLAGVICMRD